MTFESFFGGGFLSFLLLSLCLYLAWFQVSHFRFESMNFDWVHFIPAVIFNAFTVHDYLFIIPLILTDGIIGGILSVAICYYLFRKK